MSVQKAICRVGSSGIGIYIQEKGTNLIYYSYKNLKKRSGLDIVFSNDQKLDWTNTYTIADPSCSITVVVLKNNEEVGVKPFQSTKTDINYKEPIYFLCFDAQQQLKIDTAKSLQDMDEYPERYNHIKDGSLIFNNTWNDFFGIRL